MIQAPQIQYVPQLPVLTGNQQQGAYIPVQPQNVPIPGAIYNYPVASSYAPVQGTGSEKYNGVNIEILNPQGVGNSPYSGGVQNVMPQNMMQSPGVYPANNGGKGQYNGVNIEILNPQGVGNSPYPGGMQNVMPAQFYPAMHLPQAYQQALNSAPFIQNQPQIQAPNVPSPVIQQENVSQPPTIDVTPSEINQENVSQTPIIDVPSEPVPNKLVESFAGRLKTDNLDDQTTAMEEIANKLSFDEDGKDLIDDIIVDALTDIINKDTSNLEGPTPEVLELREYYNQNNINTDELPPDEQQKIAASPFEKAETNKEYALYTLSFIQERINNELAKKNEPPCPFKLLPGMDPIVDVLKDNPNPELRLSALTALNHIARPEYANDLSMMYELAQSDSDPEISKTAEDALKNLNSL